MVQLNPLSGCQDDILHANSSAKYVENLNICQRCVCVCVCMCVCVCACLCMQACAHVSACLWPWPMFIAQKASHHIAKDVQYLCRREAFKIVHFAHSWLV